MKHVLMLLLFFLASFSIDAQNPAIIGSEKGVKEKILKIKKFFPDFKKSLVTRDPLFTEEKHYEVKMKMGDGFIRFEESDDTQQILIVNFSGPNYHSGSMDDFKKYYGQLAEMLKDIFGDKYTPEEHNTERGWNMTFTETGKKSYQSATSIGLKMNWLFNRPSIELYFSTYPSGKKPKT